MSDFWIDVFDAADVRQNANTQAVSAVRITERINQIGELSFTLPAIVAVQIGAGKGRRYRLYHSDEGYLGVFTHNDMTLDANGETATITAHDSLLAAANACIGFGRAFTNTPISTILASILSPLGWTASFEAGFDSSQTLTLEYRGESVLRGMDVLRQFERGYFRRQSDTSVQFGGFAATTPAARLFGPVAAYDQTVTDYAAITSLKRERKGSSVINRVYPFGAGIGETQVDLSYSDRTTPYTIQSAAINGGEVVWFIEDAASVAQYGRIERVLPVTEIRPITNSAADLRNAANALYDMSTAFLQKYRVEQDVYSISCVGLPAGVKVGDLIRVDYSGVCELETGATAFLALTNQRFFITEIVRDFGTAGDPVYQLTVSSNGEEIVGSVEVFSNLIEDINKFKIRVQPTMTYYTKASPTLPIDPTRFVDFTFYVGSEVLAINEMKVEFRLMPLRSFANNVSTAGSTVGSTASGGGATATSFSGGGSTPTSSAGGSTTATSSGGGPYHTHSLFVKNSGSGNLVYWDGSNLISASGGGASALPIVATDISHTHTVPIPDHSHTVPVPAHTHDVPIPAHTHTVTIPAHTHSLSFGVIDDTQTPQTVTVKVNGTAVGSIMNADTGVVIGSSVSGAGLYLVDILSVITASDFRNRTHTIRFECGSQQGQVFAQLLSRVTIQPIAV